METDKMMNRREFLKSMALAAAGALVPDFKKALHDPAKTVPSIESIIADDPEWAPSNAYERMGYETMRAWSDGYDPPTMFFVGPGAGDDKNNDGADPRYPLNTLQQAIDNAGSFDVIVFMPSDGTCEFHRDWFRLL